MHRDTVTRSWGPLLCQPYIQEHLLMSKQDKDLYTIVESWKHGSSCMVSILNRHATYWTCFGCSGSAYTTECTSSCQYQATSHSHWTGVDQHSDGPQSTPWWILCEGDVWHRMMQMVVTRDTNRFSGSKRLKRGTWSETRGRQDNRKHNKKGNTNMTIWYSWCLLIAYIFNIHHNNWLCRLWSLVNYVFVINRWAKWFKGVCLSSSPPLNMM